MQYFSKILPMILPTIAVIGFMGYISYRNKKAADNHQVRILPAMCIILNILIILAIAFFVFIMLYTNEYPIVIWILSACLIIVDIMVSIAFYRFKIIYDETGFYYQSSFGKYKRYDYTEVRCFTIGRNSIFYMENGKKIKLEWGHENRDRFLKAVTEGYYKATGTMQQQAYTNC